MYTLLKEYAYRVVRKLGDSRNKLNRHISQQQRK